MAENARCTVRRNVMVDALDYIDMYCCIRYAPVNAVSAHCTHPIRNETLADRQKELLWKVIQLRTNCAHHLLAFSMHSRCDELTAAENWYSLQPEAMYKHSVACEMQERMCCGIRQEPRQLKTNLTAQVNITFLRSQDGGVSASGERYEDLYHLPCGSLSNNNNSKRFIKKLLRVHSRNRR